MLSLPDIAADRKDRIADQPVQRGIGQVAFRVIINFGLHHVRDRFRAIDHEDRRARVRHPHHETVICVFGHQLDQVVVAGKQPVYDDLGSRGKENRRGGGDKSRSCGCFLQANGAECKSVEIVPTLLVDRHQELKVRPQQVVAKFSELAHRDKVAKPGG